MTTQDPAESGEYQTSDEVLTGYIRGETFGRKKVEYSLVDGDPIFEGDIILDLLDETEDEPPTEGVVISGSSFRWTNGIIPYEIDSTLPNQARVTNAVAHWEEHTIIRFVKRTSGNASQYPNYVRFRPSTGCSSSVGMRGGPQFINLAGGCGLGSTIHEIGHTVGVWHEQSREDRDNWITVHTEHITAGKGHNFNQHISDGTDIGPYDYASIMHYSSKAFSKDGQATITAKGGEPIGQRIGLSAGDIATVWHIYHKLVKGADLMSMKFGSGSTTPGATNWKKYGTGTGVYLDVDTSAAEFCETPQYFTSIGGNSSHWATTGATSIYRATKTGFRVYVRWANGNPITAAQANSFKWHINWLGVGK